MSELSQRLRDGAAQLRGGEVGPHAQVMQDAADEMDALERAIAGLTARREQATAQIAGLLAELDEVRAELVVARTPIEQPAPPSGGHDELS